ncbi:MAG: sulfatase-like hydrolase/transferase [Candidatus Marinimicrobia bacterium]|nr:sulfatase-like hydrolase/transferase [Candidatus Neomarinimicrobiota bacterium]
MNKQRPNILLIITDQQRFDCLSALGHPVVRTPNLDRLAAEGTLFTSAHCATVPCGPSRTCLFTGTYTDQHGAHNNHLPMTPPDRRVLPEYLAAAGYDTALVGKLHLKPFARHFGFRHFARHDAPYTNYLADEAHASQYVADVADALFDGDRERLIRKFTEDEACVKTDNYRFSMGTKVVNDPEQHEAAWAVREAIHYLDEAWQRDKPFFLNIGFYGPHQPYLCPAPWDTSLYPPETLPLPADFNFAVEDKPILARAGVKDAYDALRAEQGWTEETFREVLSAYYAYITWIDECLGRLFDHLRAQGLYDETLIFFTADHGDLAGQYRLLYKGVSYEGAVHVPLIMRDPAAPRAGQRVAHEVTNFEVFSTCLKAAGLPIPAGCVCQDLRGVARGAAADLGPRFYLREQEAAVFAEGCKLLSLRTGAETLYEFYDLSADPLEARNLFREPACQKQVARLRAMLDDWLANRPG